jgi:hypothetical protein
VAANVADYLWFFGPLFDHQEIEIEIAIMRFNALYYSYVRGNYDRIK